MGDRVILESLLAVKYALAPVEGPPPGPGYRFWGRVNETGIWENRAFIPFGSVYRNVVSEKTVAGLGSAEARDRVALQAAIVPEAELARTGLPVLDQSVLDRAAEETWGSSDSTGSYLEAAARLAATHGRIEDFSHDRIRMSLETDMPGLVFFPIPAEPGWRFAVDGVPADPVLVHFGLWGIPVARGEHEIEVSYAPPLIVPGASVSLASIVLLGVFLCIGRRRKNVKE